MALQGMVSVWVMFGSVAHAACSATPDQLQASAEGVIEAYLLADSTKFFAARAELSEETGCLSGVPSGAQVGAIHLAYGLGAYYDQDREVAMEHFQAMAMVPGWSLPATFVERPPVSDWIRDASRRPLGPVANYPVRSGYSLIVDGRPSTELPTDRAAIVLILGPDGVVWSGVLRTGALPPDGGRWRPPVDVTPALPDRDTETNPATKRPVGVAHAARWPWLGAGVSAGGAAALWVGFAHTNADYRIVFDAIDDGASEAELGLDINDVRALERSRNASLGGACVTTGAAIGFSAVGLALRQRTSADVVVSMGPAGVTVAW